MDNASFCLLSRNWSSITDPDGMKGWVGLGTTTVSKQSAQDHGARLQLVSAPQPIDHRSDAFYRVSHQATQGVVLTFLYNVQVELYKC